jgi:hypothetical protein
MQTQAVSRQFLTVEAWVQSTERPYVICGQTCFYPSSLVFPRLSPFLLCSISICHSELEQQAHLTPQYQGTRSHPHSCKKLKGDMAFCPSTKEHITFGK